MVFGSALSGIGSAECAAIIDRALVLPA